MRVYDVTLRVRQGMATWPGDPSVELEVWPEGAGDAEAFRVSRLSLGTHTGTHVDAPAHLLRGGATVETLPMDVLVGPARVLHLADVTTVTAAALESALPDAAPPRLLLRTRASDEALLHAPTLPERYPALDAGAAAWLLANGVRLLGVDGPSVEPADAEAVHRALLGAGVVLVEGLDLAQVEPGEYLLACLPLRLVGADGAPARVVLLEG